MKALLYSPRAQLDLDEIWDYTASRWGAEQADDYVRMLAAAGERLASGHLPGQSADDVRSGYRRQVVGSHVIFYRESVESLNVVRILHQRMDVRSQLDCRRE